VNGHRTGPGAAVLVTVPSDCVVDGVGRFTGGGNQVEVAGIAKITRGLTIPLRLCFLSNNLEINWDGGNNFHMLEHLRRSPASMIRRSIRSRRGLRSTR
jgi:hypothetical protein